MKSKTQRPAKKTKSKRDPKKEMQGKAICSRIQICHRMALVDKDKLGPRPF